MLTLKDSWLEVPVASNGNAQFHYVWLRDNCPCADCKHPSTSERTLITYEIPDAVKPVSAEVADDTLKIVWDDQQHLSEYSIQWLSEFDYSGGAQNADLAKPAPHLWGNEIQANIPRFDYQALHDDPSTLLAWAESVRDVGLAIVHNAPLLEGEIERFAGFVAVVRETIYDRLHNVRATPGEYNAYNIASTSLELKPHTDMPNYNNPPGIQMFHFLANETVGGNSTAVDGFYVAERLRQEDPDAFEILAKTPVVFRMFSSKGDVQSANPLLTLDPSGELKVFRFSNQLIQPNMLDVSEMDEFYRAYRKLGRMIDSNLNKVEFRLNTGDIMVTNNLRVLHGRTSYDANSGARHLQLSYMDFDDVLSRIRMLKGEQVIKVDNTKPMKTVDFICMSDGTQQEYEFLDELEDQYKLQLPNRLIQTLAGLEYSLSGYKVSRLEHCLQGATRALRAGESKQYVAAVLLHDIGDELAPYSHSEMAAAILRPFVSDELYWVVKHHGVFQMYYYAHHSGGDRHARDQFKDHPYYESAVKFCHNYDQNCFDPDYVSESLGFFEPLVREVFAAPRPDDQEHQARYGDGAGG